MSAKSMVGAYQILHYTNLGLYKRYQTKTARLNYLFYKVQIVIIFNKRKKSYRGYTKSLQNLHKYYTALIPKFLL